MSDPFVFASVTSVTPVPSLLPTPGPTSLTPISSLTTSLPAASALPVSLPSLPTLAAAAPVSAAVTSTALPAGNYDPLRSPEDFLTWQQGLSDLIVDLFSKVLTNTTPLVQYANLPIVAPAKTLREVLIYRLVSTNKFPDGTSAMSIWIRSVTSETVVADSNMHYEDPEYMGDLVVNCLFPLMLMKWRPDFHKADYTNLKQAYMSRLFQGKLADKLGITKFVRTYGKVGDIPEKMKVDIFESFFGATFTIGDNLREGLGMMLCKELMDYCFLGVKLEEKFRETPPKTQVKQIFSRFAQGKIEEVKSQTGNTKVVKIILSNSQLDWLAKMVQEEGGQARITNRVLGEGWSTESSEEAESRAYADAMQKLNDVGINTHWATSKRSLSYLAESNIQDIRERVLVKMREPGQKGGPFRFIEFNVPSKSYEGGYETILLVGVNAEDQRTILRGMTHKVPSGGQTKGGADSDSKRKLLLRYINNQE